jgi:predicted dithiol-disulfide oxidoreductase (DUF899 family)
MNEKAFTRTRDRLAAERRLMPWMPVEKAYQFEASAKVLEQVRRGREAGQAGDDK